MIVGLTGGIATGKSTVSAMFLHRGAYLIDCDIVAREVVSPGQEGLKQLIIRFGEEILLPDGSLDRKRLGSIIFHDENERKALNDITHPIIRKRVRDYITKNLEKNPEQIIIVDVPLLFEGDMVKMMDTTLLVYVNEQIQLERLIERDKLSLEQAQSRLKAQMPIEEKKKLADIVIDNSGTIEETEKQVNKMWHQWQQVGK